MVTLQPGRQAHRLVAVEVRQEVALELVVAAVLVEVGRKGGVLVGHQRSWVVGLVLAGVVVVGLLAMRATFSSAVAASVASVVASLARVAYSSVLPSSPARRSSVFAEEIARVVHHASRLRQS
jgi:hypothetical protein